jgi:hypothetical protein
MKLNPLWVIIALITGFALGGMGLRADLRKTREELRLIQARADKNAKDSTQFAGIRSMLQIPGNASSQTGKLHSSNNGPSISPAVATQITNTRAAATVIESNTAHRQHHVISISNQIKEAAELWNTRVALARNSFVSNVELNKEQETRFDVLVEAMNIRLSDSIDRWTEYLKTKKTLSNEDSVRMVKDLSDVMVFTYDEMDKNMPKNWREKSGENFQLFNFIDPDVATPLTEVEDILDKAGGPGADHDTTPAGAIPAK